MQFFISRIFLFLLSFLFTIISVSAGGTDIIKNVIKIKTYELRSDNSYVFKGYGSAIAISSSRILTNAHVILDSEGLPTGRYEVCFSSDFERVPLCRETARLIAYDTVADLAILELSHTDSLVPFTLASSKIALGSYVSMYGYPGIGGETITRTEGKIAGYEQTMYKIDGSIDYGNSGGGAFNNSGELVGIPTAVAADNSSIGYMIPIQRIQSFLAKRTNNYEIYTHSVDRKFIKFLQRNQSYTSTKAFLKWKDLIVKNARPYGFVLRSSLLSADNTMVNWMFSDSYERVKITFSCTDDAGKISGWQSRRDGLKKEQQTYPNWQIKFVEDDTFFTVYSSSKGYNPSVTLYYKKYDACFAQIDYLDEKKDARSLDRAIKFMKNGVSFSGEYTLKDFHKNQFFSIFDIKKDTRIIRSIDQFGIESVLVGIEIFPEQWINAVIEGKEYASLEEISADLNVDFDEVKTWKQYIDLGIKNGIKASDIHLVSLGANQKGILYSKYNSEKKVTGVEFEYIYRLADGKYAFWTWSTTIPGEVNISNTRIDSIFASLIYPGQSVLKD